MKKNTLITLSVVFVFVLGVAAYAFTVSSLHSAVSVNCCKKGDSCPMKGKDESSKMTAACCDMKDCCCKKGDSCPMMKSGEHKEHTDAGIDHSSKAGACSCPCCADKPKA